MSGSDDGDFGGLSPTTPVVRVKKATLARTSKPNGHAEPGPSSKPRGRKKGIDNPPEHSDVEEFIPDPPNEDDENIMLVDPVRPSRKPPLRGEKSAKSKGKAKAAAPKATRKPAPEPMDEDIEILDEPEDDQGGPAEVAEAINNANRHRRTNAVATRPGKHVDVSRLTEQLCRAEAQITILSQQLEESFQIRETEAEQLLKRQEAQYETQLQAQELLIKELTSQLALKEPLMRSGNTSVLHLLTREAADEEKRTLEKETAKWKEIVGDNMRATDEYKMKIAELQQTEKDLRTELKAEIDRSASLVAKSSRNTTSAVRVGRPGGVDDPRHAEVLRFYEDVTNLLVPTMKVVPGKYFNLEDWVLSCVYTYIDTDTETAVTTKKSLNFTLRLCHEPPDLSEPMVSKDQLVPTVNYIPLELDKEPTDFVDKLGFLNTPFTFARDQLPLFLRTVFSNMGEAISEDSDNEGSVQIIGERS